MKTILQGGAPKCGNFWLYQIVQQILKLSGQDCASFIEKQPIYTLARSWDLNFPDQARIDVLEITDLQFYYRISSVFKMPIENIGEYISQTTHVWTHSPICKRSDEVFALFDKKIYIIRDPRDRAISAARYYCSEYMLKYFPQKEKDPEEFLKKNLEKLMWEWVWHVWDHLRLSQKYNIQIIFFEGFKNDFRQELDLLLDYLEVDLRDQQKTKLEEAVSFGTLKSKNPKHLKKGGSGYWMAKFTDEQLEKTQQIAGPLIDFLGYPQDRYQSMAINRPFPHFDFEKLKQQILSKEGRN